MTSIAIMQPTYLPWTGYFDLMARVDTFVFLDDVQFERRSWQMRNRIMGPNGEIVLSLATRKAPQSALIKDIEINSDHEGVADHCTILVKTFGATADVNRLCSMLERAMADSRGLLAELTIGLTVQIARQLRIDTQVVRSSSLVVDGQRSRRLEAICRRLGATHYLSPPGSRQYLMEEDFGCVDGIALEFHEFQCRPYPQKWGRGGFVSHMSIADVIGSVGFEGASDAVRANDSADVVTGDR